jgi:uncharacterized membrane protein YfcA
MDRYLLFFIITFAGSVIQGALSFGYAIFLMAVLPFILPIKTASVLTAISGVFISGTVCWRFRKSINFRAIVIPLIVALIFIPPGVYLLKVLSEVILKKILGLFIILFSLSFVAFANRKTCFKSTLTIQFITGGVSGLLTGLFNVGGPPMVFFLLATIEDNIVYKASLEFVFIALSVVTIISHGLFGNIQSNLAMYIIISFAATISGTFLGLYFFKKLDRYQLNRFVYLMMLILGALLILK